MADKDNKYWQDRQEKKYLAGEKKINQYYKDLEKSFEQAKKEIQTVINDFVVRYSIENDTPGGYATALRKLNKTEIGDLQAFIDKVNEHMGEYDQELNNMSIKARITRYQALEKQIDATLQQLYAIEYQYKSEELLKEVYYDSYYQTWFNCDQYHGFHSEFAQINVQTVEELIKYPFNGADFSTRLWKQKDHMLQQLNESITTMLIQGKSPMTLSRDFSKKFGTKEYEAYRLLHTEGSFIMEQASQAAYAEDGVEKYQWLATLDIKTCERCAERDGKTYDVGKGIAGVSMPPLHAFDRCTTVPYYDDTDLSEDTRAARDPVTGKSYDVPADMKYDEWKEQYVKPITKSKSKLSEFVEEFNNGQKDTIKLKSIEKNLNKTSVGADTFKYLKDNPCNINIYYNVDVPSNEYGQQLPIFDEIDIYASNTKTIQKTAETIIHEATHRRYNIGGDLHAECICKAQEYRHRYNTDKLTGEQLRSIIKEIKGAYPEFIWRRK